MSETIDRAATRPAAPDQNTSTTAAAAAAAQAARDAAQGVRDPVRRAELGWEFAERTLPPGAGPAAQAVARVGASARTAMDRTDLPPEQARQVRTVVERLGNAVLDRRIDPHVNDTFRQHLYTLATSGDKSEIAGALAQLKATADVLDRAPLAKGTRVAYDPVKDNGMGRTGLPSPDVAQLDADVYYRTKDGGLHLHNVKQNPSALAREVAHQDKAGSGTLTQLARQQQWQAGGTAAEPRVLAYHMVEPGPHFDKLLAGNNVDHLARLAGGDETSRRFIVGDRAYSVQDFRRMQADGTARAQVHVEALRRQHAASGGAPDTFDARKAFGAYYATHAATPELAAKNFGGVYGEPLRPLTPLPRIELPTVRQGGAHGAVGGAVVAVVRLANDGKPAFDAAKDVAGHTALGAATGAAAAAGERVLTPRLDRAIGPGVERAARSVAERAVTAIPEKAAAIGAGTRTLATRMGGATVVGAALGAGVSAYENRAGLAKGDSKAIGNVAADTGVAVGSIAAGMAAGAAVSGVVAAVATGAAAGSVVPVAGTIVGAAVGLGVGVYAAYSANTSGMRDAVANKVAGWVDGVKGWF